MPRKSKRKTKRKSAQVSSIGSLLPAIESLPKCSFHVRYKATAVTPCAMSVTTLLNSVVAFSTTSTAGCGLITAARIRRARVIDTTGASITLVWGPGPVSTGGSDITKIAFGNSMFPSKIDVRPPKESGAAMWVSSSSSNALLTITPGSSTGTFLDLWFEAIITGVCNTITTTATGTAGTVYFTPFDGVGASPVLPSVMANNIA
jgi:hypothetical protein